MKTADRLHEHIHSSYFKLRMGIAVLVLFFPLMLWVGGALKGIELQPSMSAYYHASNGDRSMRDVFVGILCAVGVFLYLYKGYSGRENIALNLAGIFAVGVAMVPMEWTCSGECHWYSMHGVFAASLFLCIAYVSIFCASDTLPALKNEKLEKTFRRRYLVLGASMVLAPVAAFLLAVVFERLEGFVYVAEAASIAVFATFWLVKSRELALSNLERAVALRAAATLEPAPAA